MLVTFLVFAAVTFTVLIIALIILYPSKKKFSTVPGLDPSDDRLGNISDIREIGSFHEFLIQLHQNFGSIASFWLKDQFCISLSTGTGFKDVQKLTERPSIFFDSSIPILGQKLTHLCNGEKGRKAHRIYTLALGHEVSCKLLPKFNKVSKDLVSVLARIPDDEHVPVHAYMTAVAIKMLCWTHFGDYFKDDASVRKLHNSVVEVMEKLNKTFPSADEENPDSECGNQSENLKRIVQEVIYSHKEARKTKIGEEAPLLDAVLENTSSDEEAISVIISFIIGGFHATGNFLTWIFYYVALCPDIQKRIIVEIEAVLKGNDLDESSIPRLTYTRQVMQETLRISSVSTFAARISPDHEVRIEGHLIPPRTPVVLNLFSSLNNEKVHVDPGKFDPERFSKNSLETHTSWDFLPFGLPGRECPGQKFSRFEALSVLITFLQNFSFIPAFENDFFVQPTYGSMFCKPETEIWIKIKGRRRRAKS